MSARDGSGAAAVRAEGWGWRHAGRGTPAVSDLDLVIEPGERVLLLGPSGAGKSTLLHAMAGILGGEEEGDETGVLTVDGRHPAAERGVSGLVLQDPDTQAVLARVGDDVAFGCENLGVPRDEIWRRVAAALDDVGLDVPLDRSTSALSGGQKQRLALAGVLAMGPRLLLLDEPTANLDPEGVLEVRAAVERAVVRSGATLVVIEHRVDVWLDVVDRVVVLDPAGGVLADGAPEAVLREARPTLERAGVWLPGAVAEPRARSTAVGSIALEVESLSIGREGPLRRRGRVGGVAVAEGLDLRIEAGAVTALLGPNGAGKSTLALTLAGLLEPVAGRVRAAPEIAGGLAREPFRWTSRQLAARSAMVFQEPEHQFLAATVRAELLLGPLRAGRPEGEARASADAMLATLGLDALAEANPFTLSGGEKRRLSVATALIGRTPVVILDEPTFGQDRRTWGVVVDLLAQARDAGAAIVAATHDGAVVSALADHTVVLGASTAEALR